MPTVLERLKLENCVCGQPRLHRDRVLKTNKNSPDNQVCYSFLVWPLWSPQKDPACLPTHTPAAQLGSVNPTNHIAFSYHIHPQPPSTHLPPTHLIFWNHFCSSQEKPSETPECSLVCALPGGEGPFCSAFSLCHTQTLTGTTLYDPTSASWSRHSTHIP